MKIKNYLVTGGAGFIGSHLCESLINLGHKVIIIDNFSIGKKENIRNIKKKIKVYNKNLSDFNLNIFKKNKIDVIIHLSSQTSVPLSIKDFKNSTSNNILSFINLLDFAKNKNIPIVYASSSAIYGNLEFGDDKKNKFDLISPYAVDKYVLEKYSEMFFKTNNLLTRRNFID